MAFLQVGKGIYHFFLELYLFPVLSVYSVLMKNDDNNEQTQKTKGKET